MPPPKPDTEVSPGCPSLSLTRTSRSHCPTDPRTRRRSPPATGGPYVKAAVFATPRQRGKHLPAPCRTQADRSRNLECELGSTQQHPGVAYYAGRVAGGFGAVAVVDQFELRRVAGVDQRLHAHYGREYAAHADLVPRTRLVQLSRVAGEHGVDRQHIEATVLRLAREVVHVARDDKQGRVMRVLLEHRRQRLGQKTQLLVPP